MLAVAQPDDGGAFVGEDGEAQGGVVGPVAQCGVLVRVDRVGAEQVEVVLEFVAQAVRGGLARVQVGGQGVEGGQGLLGGGGLGEPGLVLKGGVVGQVRPADDGGSNAPWTTRVTTMTPAVTNTMVLRSGNGAPSSRVVGTESATARRPHLGTRTVR